jgi:hypothetical protein
MSNLQKAPPQITSKMAYHFFFDIFKMTVKMFKNYQKEQDVALK